MRGGNGVRDVVGRACAALCLALGASSLCADGAVTTFADGLVPTQELHVAVGGSNSTGDGSVTNPYATIQFAVSRGGPGTAVRVHPGTYGGGEYIANVSGTASAGVGGGVVAVRTWSTA